MTSAELSTSDTGVAVARVLLARLADADFDGLADAFESDLEALATLPAGVFRWPDPATVTAVFQQWFGDVDEYRLTDFAYSRLGSRLQVRWRISVAALKELTSTIPAAASSTETPSGPATRSTARRAASRSSVIRPPRKRSASISPRTTSASVTVGSIPSP